jgi:hypothetical protein
MSLLDAKEYDPRPAQRRKRLITIIVLAIGIPVAAWYWYFHIHFGPERNAVDKFFTALERKDFDTAYGINRGDLDWKQHPDKYASYPVGRFTVDWGPSGDYGPITSHQIDCSLEPPKKNFVASSGVVVVVTINGRAESKSMWVEKQTRSVGDSPVTGQCQGKD